LLASAHAGELFRRWMPSHATIATDIAPGKGLVAASPNMLWESIRMSRVQFIVATCTMLVATAGCMMVDKMSDPEGFENGTYKPTFPWYPEYLFSRDAREYGRWWRENPQAMEKMRDPAAAHPAGCACCSAAAVD
jgi:hypothetical protein